MDHRNLSEYLSLQKAIRAVQTGLQNEVTAQQQIREDITALYAQIASIFAQYWPPLHEKQVE